MTQVPVGARVVVRAVPTGSHKTVVTLHAWGLLPDETYGAHAHYKACGATGAAAGAHYQNAQDPAVGGSETTASVNPSYANPGNEVWLDLVTNDDGNGRAQTVVDWPFRPTATGAPPLGDPAPQHHQHRWLGATGQRRGAAGLRHRSVLIGVQATAEYDDDGQRGDQRASRTTRSTPTCCARPAPVTGPRSRRCTAGTHRGWSSG